MGFNNHKQEVFNFVQALKMLFLHRQSKKDTVEEYTQNFRSLWDMVEAFGGLQGNHKELTDMILKVTVTAGLVATEAQLKAAGREDLSDVVKATLLISGANRCCYGTLKDALASNYLLGSDQYPDTFEKALRILGNYQTTKILVPYKASPNDTGLLDWRFYRDAAGVAADVAEEETAERRAKRAQMQGTGMRSAR